jgi:hypothetical protein
LDFNFRPLMDEARPKAERPRDSNFIGPVYCVIPFHKQP